MIGHNADAVTAKTGKTHHDILGKAFLNFVKFTFIYQKRDYREKFANPYIAASRGYIDDIIEPSSTRARLINGLEMLSNKRDKNPGKKHGNIPL